MTELLRRGGEAARVGPWRGAADTALLAPAPGYLGSPSPSFLEWCGAQLAAKGFQRAVSSALLPSDTTPYLVAGFTVLEQLHLLSRRLDGLPQLPASEARLRKGKRRDLPVVVDIDQQAFQPFWRFDADGISEARTITPKARFRVAEDEAGIIVGYAVTGLGEEQGYLQRLAVMPQRQRRGTGAALVIDALEWLARRHAFRVMVNTQVGNDRALSLYTRLGFQLEPVRLEVLALDLR
jgi:ribosomal protein S18 acetylase RimI-like enzyme